MLPNVFIHLQAEGTKIRVSGACYFHLLQCPVRNPLKFSSYCLKSAVTLDSKNRRASQADHTKMRTSLKRSNHLLGSRLSLQAIMTSLNHLAESELRYRSTNPHLAQDCLIMHIFPCLFSFYI
jgi:hypothetical protein